MINFSKFLIPLLFIFAFTFTHAQNMKSEIIIRNNTEIERIFYTPNNKISEHLYKLENDDWITVKNTYTKSLIEKADYYLHDEIFVSYQYFYDDNNNLVESRETNGSRIMSTHYFTYNNKEILTNETSEHNNYKMDIEYEYNNDNLLYARLETIENKSSKIFNSEFFEYNEKNLPTASIQMSGIDTTIVHLYKYDENNRCNHLYVVSSGDTINHIEWEFIKDTDQIKKETHFKDEYIMRREKFKYNSKGHLAKQIIIDYRITSDMPESKKVTYQHKYTYYD